MTRAEKEKRATGRGKSGMTTRTNGDPDRGKNNLSKVLVWGIRTPRHMILYVYGLVLRKMS